MFFSKDKPSLDSVNSSPSFCDFQVLQTGIDSTACRAAGPVSAADASAAPAGSCSCPCDCARHAAPSDTMVMSNPLQYAGPFLAVLFISNSRPNGPPASHRTAHQRVAMKAVVAAASASCATAIRFFQLFEPPMAFSGTTMVSPGSMTVERMPPFHNALPWLLSTDPLARMMNTCLTFPWSVGPPAWRRYQPAARRGR